MPSTTVSSPSAKTVSSTSALDKKKNYVVNKSSELAYAQYDLTLNEQRIMSYIVAHINPTVNDDSQRFFEFKISEFCDLLGLQHSNVYKKKLRPILQNLREKQFYIYNKKGQREIEGSWIASTDYHASGTIIIEISSKLYPYLVELSQYVAYKLEYIIPLRCKYSFRVYELAKSKLFKNTKKTSFYMSQEELEFIFLIKDKYKTFGEVNRRVIKTSTEELNKYTDIHIDIDIIKDGRKATGWEFTVKNKLLKGESEQISIIDYVEEEEATSEIIKALQEVCAVSDKEKDIINKYIEKKGIDYVADKINYVKSMSPTDFFKYLISALKDDYKKDAVQTKKTNKSSFSEAEYETMSRLMMGHALCGKYESKGGR